MRKWLLGGLLVVFICGSYARAGAVAPSRLAFEWTVTGFPVWSATPIGPLKSGYSYRLYVRLSDRKGHYEDCTVSDKGSFADYLPCAWKYAQWIASARYGDKAAKLLAPLPPPPITFQLGHVECGGVTASGCFSPARYPSIRVTNTGEGDEWFTTTVHEYVHLIGYALMSGDGYEREAAWLDSIPDICATRLDEIGHADMSHRTR